MPASGFRVAFEGHHRAATQAVDGAGKEWAGEEEDAVGEDEDTGDGGGGQYGAAGGGGSRR